MQLLPAASGARRARIRWLPSLAGVGAAGHVALTFDDGPDPASTPAFLDALDDLGWRATFFMLGRMVAAHPELAAEVSRRGHEIGVHGYSHSNHMFRGPAWARRRPGRPGPPGRGDWGAHGLAAPPLRGAGGLDAGRRPGGGVTTGVVDHLGPDWREQATPESIVKTSPARWSPVPPSCTRFRLHIGPRQLENTLAALPGLAERWAAGGLGGAAAASTAWRRDGVTAGRR